MTNSTEPLDASVTLEEIVAVVAQKRAPLAPELAGYLVLELAEAAPNAAEIDPHNVYVSEEGSVAVVRGPHEPGGSAEMPLRRLLARLLDTAGAQTPALAAVARRKGGEGAAVLVEELEAALIPVNRSAGKRALARLARETKRVTNRVGRNASAPAIQAPNVAAEPLPHTSPAPAHAKPDESASSLPTVGISKEDLDAAASLTKRDSVDSLIDAFESSGQLEEKALAQELKAMAGLDPTPPPVGMPATDSADSHEARPRDSIESLLAESAPPSPKLTIDTGRESPVARRRSDPAPAGDRSRTKSERPGGERDRQLTTAPSQVKQLRMSLTNEVPRKKSGPGIGVLLLMALVLAGLAVALWLLKPGFLTGRTPEKIAQERAAAEAERVRIAAQHAQPACHASLGVSGAPNNAEILVREGQGSPVDVDHMPMGVRLEFVATAEGYAPKRAIVAADAQWDTSTGKPRFDLPLQLDKSKARANALDPWPPADPDTEVGGKGNPGVVHVITSPKGAEVWLLAGSGPDTKASDPVMLEDIAPCDTDVDVLVAGATYRKKLHVRAASFVPDPSGKAGVRIAQVTVK
jgi:hypothetical protein